MKCSHKQLRENSRFSVPIFFVCGRLIPFITPPIVRFASKSIPTRIFHIITNLWIFNSIVSKLDPLMVYTSYFLEVFTPLWPNPLTDLLKNQYNPHFAYNYLLLNSFIVSKLQPNVFMGSLCSVLTQPLKIFAWDSGISVFILN